MSNINMNLCMLCGAEGQDKRTLNISCFYDIREVVPEVILSQKKDSTETEWSLRICKACRGRLLEHLAIWRKECVANRGLEKDSDGEIMDLLENKERNIPCREFGRTIMLTKKEYEKRKGGSNFVKSN